jgi:Na+/proline symporter
MLLLTHLQNRFTSYSSHAVEEFATASRSVKPGLIAAGIVSSWTWPGTLLTSSTVTSTYGIQGAFNWACFSCFQIALFSLLAVMIKRNAPGLHTYPELIRARHGTAAHLSYLFFARLTNLLVGSTLVLGGAQVVSALTGVNVYAANFIVIPLNPHGHTQEANETWYRFLSLSPLVSLLAGSSFQRSENC